MWHCACHMSYVKCLCWFLGHAEQLLFWCLCSKVSICDYVTCHISHVTCHIAHVTCHMSNAYVDPWDMLNNFCFHVYTQKWVFVIMSHVTSNMSHCTCHMSYVKCLCWFLGHAEQLLFWCLCSKVSICDYVTCRMSHVICEMLMLILGTCWTTFVFMCKLKSEYL